MSDRSKIGKRAAGRLLDGVEHDECPRVTTPRRHKTKNWVERRRRVYRVVTVRREVLQCERPYVLFGAAVREARKRRAWTQQQLADALKLTRGSIANIESGRQRVLLSDWPP